MIFGLTKNFPKDELYGLTSQIKRSALSIPANIVEGFARGTQKEYVRFLFISWGSLAETEYYLKFSYKLQYITKSELDSSLLLLKEISRMLNGLIKKIKLKITSV
ncbi:MAG: four helix bundle protein [Patescibacteria group bacterium]|nr:four helix bundle protein [Patescibacteria group bacterium]